MEEGEVESCFGTINENKVPAAVISAAGIFMFRNLLLIIAALTLSAAMLSAQTPVEKVILKYEDASGARNFIAQGLKMTLARNLLKSTQVAPVASDVDQLYVLKM